MRIIRAAGSAEKFIGAAAVETQLEISLLRAGGVIPLILNKTIAAQVPMRAADEDASAF